MLLDYWVAPQLRNVRHVYKYFLQATMQYDMCVLKAIKVDSKMRAYVYVYVYLYCFRRRIFFYIFDYY